MHHQQGNDMQHGLPSTLSWWILVPRLVVRQLGTWLQSTQKTPWDWLCIWCVIKYGNWNNKIRVWWNDGGVGVTWLPCIWLLECFIGLVIEPWSNSECNLGSHVLGKLPFKATVFSTCTPDIFHLQGFVVLQDDDFFYQSYFMVCKHSVQASCHRFWLSCHLAYLRGVGWVDHGVQAEISFIRGWDFWCSRQWCNQDQVAYHGSSTRFQWTNGWRRRHGWHALSLWAQVSGGSAEPCRDQGTRAQDC